MATDPRNSLSAMPWHILESIVENSDAISRIALRRCSRTLCRSVDRASPPYYGMISIELHAGRLELDVESESPLVRSVAYCEIEHEFSAREANRRRIVKAADYIEHALRDIASILHSNTSYVGFLKIKITERHFNSISQEKKDKFWRQFLEALSGFGQQLYVEKLSLNGQMTEDRIMSILEKLQPGCLIDISLNTRFSALNRVVESEYWKNAKYMVVNCESIPVEKFYHFNGASFTLQHFSTLILKTLVQAILLQGDDFEFFEVDLPSGTQNWYRRVIGELATPYGYVRGGKFVPIPGTQSSLQVSVKRQSMLICRVTNY